jgi:hypothetical protein
VRKSIDTTILTTETSDSRDPNITIISSEPFLKVGNTSFAMS